TMFNHRWAPDEGFVGLAVDGLFGGAFWASLLVRSDGSNKRFAGKTDLLTVPALIRFGEGLIELCRRIRKNSRRIGLTFADRKMIQAGGPDCFCGSRTDLAAV
ncbi:MAG: hypothetical protein ACYS4W_15085, partial [Planctomycetota bacterium]